MSVNNSNIDSNFIEMMQTSLESMHQSTNHSHHTILSALQSMIAMLEGVQEQNAPVDPDGNSEGDQGGQNGGNQGFQQKLAQPESAKKAPERTQTKTAPQKTTQLKASPQISQWTQLIQNELNSKTPSCLPSAFLALSDKQMNPQASQERKQGVSQLSQLFSSLSKNEDHETTSDTTPSTTNPYLQFIDKMIGLMSKTTTWNIDNSAFQAKAQQTINQDALNNAQANLNSAESEEQQSTDESKGQKWMTAVKDICEIAIAAVLACSGCEVLAGMMMVMMVLSMFDVPQDIINWGTQVLESCGMSDTAATALASALYFVATALIVGGIGVGASAIQDTAKAAMKGTKDVAKATVDVTTDVVEDGAGDVAEGADTKATTGTTVEKGGTMDREAAEAAKKKKSRNPFRKLSKSTNLMMYATSQALGQSQVLTNLAAMIPNEEAQKIVKGLAVVLEIGISAVGTMGASSALIGESMEAGNKTKSVMKFAMMATAGFSLLEGVSDVSIAAIDLRQGITQKNLTESMANIDFNESIANMTNQYFQGVQESIASSISSSMQLIDQMVSGFGREGEAWAQALQG